MEEKIFEVAGWVAGLISLGLAGFLWGVRDLGRKRVRLLLGELFFTAALIFSLDSISSMSLVWTIAGLLFLLGLNSSTAPD